MMSIYLRRFWWHGNDNMKCKLSFGFSCLVASNAAKSTIVIHWSSAQEELTFPLPSSTAHTVDIVVLPHIDIIDQSGAIVNLSLFVHPPNIGLRNSLQQIRSFDTTVLENSKKCSIWVWQTRPKWMSLGKSSLKMLKWSIWRVYGKTIACGQTVLPDRSIINWTNVDRKCQNRNWQYWKTRLFAVIFRHCVCIVLLSPLLLSL